MSAKYARYEKYVIKQNSDKSIVVFLEYDNVKESLRTLASELNFDVDPKWNTRQLGSKLIKEHGKDGWLFLGNNGVHILDSGAIDSYQWFKNTKEGLREIAEKCGFDFDPKWNTQQFGAKLMEFLNKK